MAVAGRFEVRWDAASESGAVVFEGAFGRLSAGDYARQVAPELARCSTAFLEVVDPDHADPHTRAPRTLSAYVWRSGAGWYRLRGAPIFGLEAEAVPAAAE